MGLLIDGVCLCVVKRREVHVPTVICMHLHTKPRSIHRSMAFTWHSVFVFVFFQEYFDESVTFAFALKHKADLPLKHA